MELLRRGNTILNFSGVKSNLIFYVCDMAKIKAKINFSPESHAN